MAEVCIRYRRGNEEEATESLSNYLTEIDKTFGGLKDNCIVEDKKLHEQLQTNFLRLSPKRLSNGAAVLYITIPTRQNRDYKRADGSALYHLDRKSDPTHQAARQIVRGGGLCPAGALDGFARRPAR